MNKELHMSDKLKIGKYSCTLIDSGGQGKIYLHTSPSGENLVIKKHNRGISNDFCNQSMIEKNNRIPFAVQIKEVIPEEHAIVMKYYSTLEYGTLNDIINNVDLNFRINAAHLILQKIAIYLLFAERASLLPHSDLNPKNILVKKDFLNSDLKSYCSFSNIDNSLLSLTGKFWPKLEEIRDSFLNDASIVLIDSWRYDGSYDAGIIQVAPEFQSPEQTNNEIVTSSSDIYQVGLIYYSILTGDARNAQSLLPLVKYNRVIPSQFEQILRGITQLEPSRRLSLIQSLKAFTWAKLYFADRKACLRDRNFPLLPERPNIKKDIEDIQNLRVRINGKALTVIALTPLLTSKCPELKIEVKDSPVRFQVPTEILDVAQDWIHDRVERERLRQEDEFDLANLFFNGDQIRIDSLKYKVDEKASFIQVNIKTSRTRFYDEKMTNEFCNRLLISGETVYEVFGGRYQDLTDSQLANPLAVNFLVVTSDGFILICKRGKLANNLGQNDSRKIPLVPSVSGTIDPLTCINDKGVFQLNRAVIVEYEEEVFNDHLINDDQILYLGLARTQAFLYPFVYGMIFSGKTSREHENADRGKNGIIECHGWEYIENNINSINNWMKRMINQRNPDGSYYNTSDTLLFHLYRYAAWLNMKSDSPMSQMDFDRMFDPISEFH
jgi:serine/threonine protein kinase